uniref:E3 ubiquitin-protein ligase n=1 Tax=Ditylenchus dipsaci TaxID=166011 RepID=A0A915DH42_9BILA
MFHKDCIESLQSKKQCPNCMKYSAAGWHEIQYNVPSGVQSDENLRPGVKFHGTTRIAYLPDSRLIFTIGDSVTTGQKNVVTWNGIHHKTSMLGGRRSEFMLYPIIVSIY